MPRSEDAGSDGKSILLFCGATHFLIRKSVMLISSRENGKDTYVDKLEY